MGGDAGCVHKETISRDKPVLRAAVLAEVQAVNDCGLFVP